MLARPCGRERQQRAPEVLDRRKPLRRIDFIARSVTSSISGGNLRPALAGGRGVPADDALEDDEEGVAVVGALPRQALVENDAQRVLIAGRTPADLLSMICSGAR